MNSRSAEYTLLGFYYQFDKNIFEILNQIDDNTVITVEGIEDIDISSPTENTVMQIKYQEKTTGTDSTLRKPIMLMLKHYSENHTKGLKYALYGHYSNNDDINKEFTLDRIKSMLIYTENGINKNFLENNNISEETVKQFIKKFKLELGSTFQEHQKTTFEKIKTEFGLSKVEEIETYYSNALKVINDLAIKKTISSRKITKKDFKEKIDLKNILFNHWFIKLRSKEKYLKYIHFQYFRNNLNTTHIERFFVFNITSDDIVYLKDAIYGIEKRFYKKTTRTINSGAPYIYIKNINIQKLIELKESIYNDDKRFSDGFCFSGSQFRCNEIIKQSTIENKISIKIINKKEYLEEVLSNINGTKKVFEFYDKYNNPISNNESNTLKIQIEDITDIPIIIGGRQ
jgi:hypothetical protein